MLGAVRPHALRCIVSCVLLLASYSVAVESRTCAAAPRPSIAFDQIDRVLLNGETPPPIDTFANDAAAIASLPPLSAKPLSSPVGQTASTMLVSSVLGFIPFVGGFLGAAAAHAANAAQQAQRDREVAEDHAAVQRFISAGRLSQFAFYNGWMRVEHPGKDVTIVKPAEGFTTTLDLARKTAYTVNMKESAENDVVEDNEAVPPVLHGDAQTVPLPPAIIAGAHARGYRTTGAIDLQQSLGWCSVGAHKVTQIEYVVDVADPQPPYTADAARNLADGCNPASTASYREPGKLVLYRATTIDGDSPNGTTLMFERGNIRTLTAANASLFSTPADFTQEQ